MTGRDLLKSPLWRAEDLGAPIPDSHHAVSVALPRWQDVVGYEEEHPEVIDRLKGGYPRFVVHRFVKEVAGRIAGCKPCLVFPSSNTAHMCAAFIEQQSGASAEIRTCGASWGVVTDARGTNALQAFWQHTGLIVSTRRALAELEGRGTAGDDGRSGNILRENLAALYQCSPADVYLHPTGMAAMFAALRVLNRRLPGVPTVQIGFPYVDTFKLQEKFGYGATLLTDLDRCASDLEALLKRGPLAGGFSEIPGNPLLGSADLRAITPILRKCRVPLVIDDVVATPVNIDLRNHADLIATSLTKYIAGSGDVMGGALICNSGSPYYAELKELAAALHEELLWHEDAAVLAANIVAFPERMQNHNKNGLLIAERLRKHPAVEQVWYPKWSSAAAYEAVRRPAGGWGSLIAFLSRDAARTAPRIFDTMAVCKGPSLGTIFTLACPFTLLAHYRELEWAESCGVSRYLIRISVGLEDPEELWLRIANALDQSLSPPHAGAADTTPRTS